MLLNLDVDTSTDNYVASLHNNYNTIRDFLNFTDYYANEGINNKISTVRIKAFIKRRAIEEKIVIAREALDDAINLIHEQQHPILQNENKFIISDAPLIKNKQNYYIPENQDDHYSRFTSKNNDFLIISPPYDFDYAVLEFNKYFTKYNNLTDIIERNDQGTPIITYYYNYIGSLDEIYEHLHEVDKKDIKLFKIHFQLSGVFETHYFDFEIYQDIYSYEAQEIVWKNYKSAIPILVKNEQNLEECKLYIETVLSSYETTTSNNKLTIVCSVAFTISRMRKVSGHIKELTSEFKSQHNHIIVDKDDHLC